MSDGSSISEAVSRRLDELEQQFEDLAERQDETDVSITKVLDIVQRIERNQRRLMSAHGVNPDE